MNTMKISRSDYARQTGNSKKWIDLGVAMKWVVIVEDAKPVVAPAAKPVATSPAASTRIMGHWLDPSSPDDPTRPFRGQHPGASDEQWAAGLDRDVARGYNHIVTCMSIQDRSKLGKFTVRPDSDNGRTLRRLEMAKARGLGISIMLTSDDSVAGSVYPITDQAWVRSICQAYGAYTQPAGSIIVGIEPLEYVSQSVIDATLATIKAAGFRAAYHCGNINELQTAGKNADCWFAQFGFGLSPSALAAKVTTVLGWAGSRQVIAAEYAIGSAGAAALGDEALSAGAAGALNGCTPSVWINK
jgi:hypothetical protein